ncbi:MAG TPA: hypothetical protein DEH78_13410 [Solibacterales bacterium]|nr:hypothetical protein [Bryobacterales bacterium]
MDMRDYYQRIREIEASVTEDEIVVVSLATADGGKPDVKREVSKQIGAKLVAEGRARLATSHEAEEHRSRMASDFQRAEQQALVAKTQLAVLPESELRALRQALKPSKS